ncbi:formate dehydrogenase accessory sulfurtransferase FdhD [Candidatus Formimonas warabiya]|uniref:Sulfur carrier protein FdhD n=1 Tax=Formimonas warabiya TaxID=1761012 RepID=A0A3G1KNK9_FORW1|nr:formate dehydrogenase accessory sulfurtransferase FdhD [Candidatus Formimonas warabiya]ATW24054.1 hypothetical protein DCMF_03960 [Candidatus Formimonas warabiya]
MDQDKEIKESDLAVSYVARKIKGTEWQEETMLIVREKALTIYVNTKELATIVCSPGQIRHMAVGFLCSEGILSEPQDLKSLRVDEEKGLVYAEIEGYEKSDAGKAFLRRYITPCCGRGRAAFYYLADALLCKPVESDLKIPAETVRILAKKLEENSHLFNKTGGVHSAALAEGSEMILFQEDVGRHNTLDKILGQCFLEKISLKDKIIVFSGRVSSEILLKTAKMGVPILLSRGAPTDLSLGLGKDLGITVIGFARGDSFTIYTHPERIF